MITHRLRTAAALAAALSLLTAGIALADNVQNDVTAGGNDTITAGGSTTITYRLIGNNAPQGDVQGCNVDASNPATMTVGVPPGVSASAGSVQFTACGDGGAKSVTFASSTLGSHAIIHSISGGKSGSLYNNQANFILTVNPAPAPADSTPPVITPSVSGTLGANGWYTSDVTVSWSVVDAESAISSISGCGTTTIATDTTGTTLTCTATSGGGTGNASVTIKRDATQPTISITAPALGAEYLLGAAVNAGYACADATSGVASCVGPVASGAPIDTSTVGSKTFTVDAADNAGNSRSLTHGYRVVYDFSGFRAPLDALPTRNVVKAGRAVPVKFSLNGDQGLGILATGSPSSRQVSCLGGTPESTDTETVTAGSSSLGYDSVTDEYTYVWKTNSGWAGTCRELSVTLADGKAHAIAFRFTK